ncbi:MAG TPA: XdhC family protein [Pyrinomonadaceae bacterium]|nr:XdhC family protein [Pyrinomonadaceae bacterium]
MSSANDRSHSTEIAERITRTISNGTIATLVTLIQGETNVGAKLFVEQDRVLGSLGSAELNQAVVSRVPSFVEGRDDMAVLNVRDFAPALGDFAGAQLLFERIQREPRLVICGAGHVGAALANVASLLGYQSTVIDDRQEFVTRQRFPDPHIKLVAAADWFEAVREVVSDGLGVSVVIVTRGHSEDEVCMRAVMTNGADYIGLIGSKRRIRIVLDRLREAGAQAEILDKVRGPIGLDIGAVTPEEVALAIMAEIVAVRRGGEGGSLSKLKKGKGEGKG